MNFKPISLRPRASRRPRIPPTRPRCTPSGFTITSVRSLTPAPSASQLFFAADPPEQLPSYDTAASIPNPNQRRRRARIRIAVVYGRMQLGESLGMPNYGHERTEIDGRLLREMPPEAGHEGRAADQSQERTPSNEWSMRGLRDQDVPHRRR